MSIARGGKRSTQTRVRPGGARSGQRRAAARSDERPDRLEAGRRRPEARLLVDCVVRSDALAKPGGDTVQVREYARHLEDQGVDVRELPFRPGLEFRPGAVVHVFNVDRPFEFLLACRAASGHRLVVSPIHHAARRVRLMRAADHGRGLTSLSARVLPEAPREWLATFVRSVRSAGTASARARTGLAVASAIPRIPRIWRAAGEQLDRADAVALLAEGEGRDLAALSGWRRENAVLVPNGRPGELDLEKRRRWDQRVPGSVIVVGRIEPRKRQLEVARAADALGIPVTFIGPAADESSAYAAAFTDLASRSASVTWIGPRDRASVLERMGATKVLLNASWVEVQSLVDLEAASMGCAVVTSATGHSREWLGDAITVVPGDDCERMVREAAARASDSTRPPETAEYTWTWREAADRLLQVYRDGVSASD